MRTHKSKYFYGNEISAYGLENGRLDYRTLARAFDAVRSNDIISATSSIGNWDIENGFIDNSEEIDELNERIDELMLDNENGEHDDELDELQERIDELEENNGSFLDDEIFQYFIVSDNGAEILKEYTNDPIFYNEELDMYVWGVTHWGTAWDYVLTDVVLELEEEC